MKIIDSKGNIFGRLNLIDFFLIVFIIVSFSLLAVSYGSFNKKKSRTEDVVRSVLIEIKAEASLVSDKITSIIALGDRDIKSTDSSWAVIEKIDLSSPQLYVIGNKDIENFSTVYISRHKDVTLTLKLLVKEHVGQYIYYGRVLKIGNNFTFEHSIYDLSCSIVSIKLLDGARK